MTRGRKTRYTDIGHGSVKVKQETRDNHKDRLDTETDTTDWGDKGNKETRVTRRGTRGRRSDRT